MDEEFWKFFNNFGTHVTIGVELGAKFGYFFEMSNKEVEKMREIGLSVEAGASAYSVSGSVHTSFELNSKEAFSEAMKSWK